MKMLKSFYMKPNRKNTKNVLIDLSYDGSMNEFEEFYGFSITYQELEQQSYIEFKEMMFEYINKKISPPSSPHTSCEWAQGVRVGAGGTLAPTREGMLQAGAGAGCSHPALPAHPALQPWRACVRH